MVDEQRLKELSENVLLDLAISARKNKLNYLEADVFARR